MAVVSLRGKACHTSGELPSAGTAAPDFILTNTKFKDVSLANFPGKKKLLYIVPSLDTPVCAKTTIELDTTMADYPDTQALLVSADLPFALGRFCGAQKLKNIQPLSFFRDQNFAGSYGVLLTDGPLAGLAARAVVIIDEKDKVIYSEWVEEISNEPDFNSVLGLVG